MCSFFPDCCTESWHDGCVAAAVNGCGAQCTCAELDVDDLICDTNADCAWCGDDACSGTWSCEDEVCTQDGGILCDNDDDTECIKNTCIPELATCQATPILALCNDDEPCTNDLCAETGECVFEAIEGCTGEPPFECLGNAEPSAEGCAWVESFEGCCDPWGRLLWCQGDQTWCIDCSSGNPYCGWDATALFYNCETAGGQDPSGAYPKMCPGF